MTVNPLGTAQLRSERSGSCFLNKVDLEENSDTNISDITSSHIDTEVEVGSDCILLTLMEAIFAEMSSKAVRG